MKQSVRIMQVFGDIMSIVCSMIVFLTGYFGLGRVVLPDFSPVTGIMLMFIGLVGFGVTTAKLMLLASKER